MITTRQIDDEELFQLIELNYKYYQCLKPVRSKFLSTSILINDLIKEDALATGVFKDGRLLGFTLGHKLTSTVFHFTAMYVLPEYRRYAKRLHEASESLIKGRYKAWVTEGINKEGSRMHERMGAKIISITKKEIKFYKEI